MNKDVDSAPAFFIVGYPRSGTTLLASLINRHSKIAIPPETQFFRVFMQDEERLRYSDTMGLVRYFCSSPRIKDLNLEASEFEPFIDEISQDSYKLFSVALHLYGRNLGKSIVGEKSPGHLLYWETILKEFANAKIVVIVRDGRDCVFSNIEQYWTSSNPYKHAAEWRLYIKALQNLKEAYPDKVLEVRFEALLSDARENLNNIFEFLGYDLEEIELDSNKTSESVPEWEKKWKGRVDSAPDTTRGFAWKVYSNQPLVRQLSYLMKDELQLLGYEQGSTIRLIEWLKLVVFNFTYLPVIYPLLKLVRNKIRL